MINVVLLLNVSMSKCPILVHEHRVLIAQMNYYCIKTDAKK